MAKSVVFFNSFVFDVSLLNRFRGLHCLVGSALGHRSLPPENVCCHGNASDSNNVLLHFWVNITNVTSTV